MEGEGRGWEWNDGVSRAFVSICLFYAVCFLLSVFCCLFYVLCFLLSVFEEHISQLINWYEKYFQKG